MYKLLKKITKKEFMFISFSVFFIIFSAVSDLLLPFLYLNIMEVYDKIIFNKKLNLLYDNLLSELWYYSGAMVGISLFSISCNLLSIFFSVKISISLSTRIRMDLFNHTQWLSSKDIDSFTVSSLIIRLNNDVLIVQQYLVMLFTLMIKVPCYLFGGLALSILQLTKINNPNALNIAYIFFVMPVMIISTAIIMKKAMPSFSSQRKLVDENNTLMSENLLGAKVIRAFNLQKLQNDNFNKSNLLLKKTSSRAEIYLSILIPLMMLFLNISMVLINASSSLISNTIEDLNEKSKLNRTIGSFIQYFMLILSGFILSSFGLFSFSRAVPCAKRINEVFNKKQSIINDENCVNFQNGNIKFENVSFKYNDESDEYVIKDISFEIKRGEKIGIIGPTGSGKSTLVNLISRLYDVNEGQILINNNNIKKINVSDLRNNISVALQERILFSGTIKSNLMVGKQDASLEEIIESTKWAEAYDFILSKKNMFDSVVEQRGRNFSGGQQQRLSIARALIKKPKILIFDDSTSALDNITESKVLSNINNNLKDTTLIMVAQRIRSIMNMDKIILLNEGKIIGMGTHNQLIKNNKFYKNIYDSQSTELGDENE